MRSRRLPATVAAIALLMLVEMTAVPSAGAVEALAVDSTLSLNADPASVTVGDTVSLSGTLSFADASSSAGQTITLSRDDAAGTHVLGDAMTTADGSYTADDTVDVGGHVTYHAAFAGAGGIAPSEATDTVSVGKLPTNLSIRVSDHAITFGASVRIRGHLGKGADSRVLELYAKPDGHHRVLLRRAKVNADGYLSTTYSPSRDTTFTARYDGDLRHRANEDSTVTRVRVILKAKLTRFVSTSGKYRIYRRGSYAHCEVHVSPNHAGSKVLATLQAYAGGAWKTLDTAGFRLNAKSDTSFVIRGSSNVNFRVMVRLPTHTDHLGDASRWLYLRFK